MHFLTNSLFKFKLNTREELNISFHIIIYNIILRGTDSLLGLTTFFRPANRHADQNFQKFVKKQKPQIKILYTRCSFVNLLWNTLLQCNDISLFCDEKPQQNSIT